MLSTKGNILILDSNDLVDKIAQDGLVPTDFKITRIQYLESDIILYKNDKNHVTILKNRYTTQDDVIPSVDKPGYHTVEIPKGVVGEFSKIKEECFELENAIDQDSIVMELVELSDLYGAIEMYIAKKHRLPMSELKKFSDITRRAFKNGHRS